MKKLVVVAVLVFISFITYAKVNVNGAAVGSAPLSFIENIGQVVDQNQLKRTDIGFMLHAAGGLNIFVGDAALHYQFSREDNPDPNRYKRPDAKTLAGKQKLPPASYTMYRMDVTLVGANKNAQVIKEEKQEYYDRYYTPGISRDNSIAYAYNKITYKNIYPNIDWVLYTKNGQLKHEFIVKEGGRVADITLKYGGATQLKLDSDGTLIATTPQGTITEMPPYTYQKNGNKIESHFKLRGDELTYETDNYTGEIVIDPSLAWATYYGGDESVLVNVRTDNAGNVYSDGRTNSTSMIATTGAYQTAFSGGVFDAFLVKFSSSGLPLWGTYYGGANEDAAFGLATDATGNVYISGNTNSTTGIATPGAFQTTLPDMNCTFLAKFDGAGAILWATYFGGNSIETGGCVATDGSGNVYLCGNTESSMGIATPFAYQTVLGVGGYNGYLAKFDGAGALQWATYYGGSGGITVGPYGTVLNAVTTDIAGNIYITGYTDRTSGIASPGAYQTILGGGSRDCILAKFNGSGTRIWGTYYGGAGDDEGYALTADASGNIYLVGATTETGGSTDLSSPGAYQTAVSSTYIEGFLAKFSPAGSRIWGSYYGGEGDDDVSSIAIDAGTDNLLIAGNTRSFTAIATADAYQPVYGENSDVFFAILTNDGSSRLYSTYYGGAAFEQIQSGGLVTDGTGHIFMAGSTSSASGIATPGAYRTSIDGSLNCMLIKLINCLDVPVVAAISGMTALCTGNSVALSDATAGGVWSSTNTAAAIIDIAGNVTGLAAGTTTISYTVTNTCSSTAATTNVMVNPPPNAGSITGTASFCIPGTVSLANLTGDASGTWTSGSPLVATVGGTGIITGIAAGTSVISYIVTNSCGTAIATTVATVNAAPIAGSITGTATVCTGSTTSLNDAVPGGIWSSINTAAATIDIAGNVTGLTAGTTTISYTVTNTCGSTAATMNVMVNPPPNAGGITGATSFCIPGTISLANPTGDASGTWASGSPLVATVGGTGIVTGIAAGTSVISYTVTNGCGTAVATAVATVNPTPAAGSITGAATVCTGNTTLLSDAAPSGAWSSTNTAAATIDIAGNVTGVAAGTTTISYTVTNTCGITAATRIITVNTIPSASLSPIGPIAICSGATVLLTAAPISGGLVYQWQESGSNIPGAVSATYTTGAAGNYRVVITGAGGCTGTSAAVAVSVDASGVVVPAVSISSGSGLVMCATSVPVTFTASAVNGGSSPVYNWSVNGSPVTGAGNIYTYVPANGDIVQCALTSSLPCAVPATVTASVTMTVNPLVTPAVSINPMPNDTICKGSSITYTAVTSFGGTAPAYQWTENGMVTSAAGAAYTTIPHDGDVIVCRLTSNYTPCATATLAFSAPFTTTVVESLPNTVAISTSSLSFVPGIPMTFVAIAPNAGASPVYQWFVGTTAVPGATSVTFITSALANGDVVRCRVTSSELCATPHVALSDGLTMNAALAINGQIDQDEQLALAPNPNNGSFVITGTFGTVADDHADIMITNVLGQTIYKTMANIANGKINERIALEKTLPGGVYMFSLNSGTDNKVIRFIMGR